MIASARLYEWAPSLTTAWRRLLEWTAARAGVPLDVLDTRSISLDELWSRDDLGCVFMCGYPWALAARRPALLAAPVPSMVSRSRLEVGDSHLEGPDKVCTRIPVVVLPEAGSPRHDDRRVLTYDTLTDRLATAGTDPGAAVDLIRAALLAS